MGKKRKLNIVSDSTARKKRKILKSNVNSNSATLETIFVRFPHLTEAIFGELDIPSLSLCREWNEMWKENLENRRIQPGLEKHVFWGMKKLVQLKIVHPKVSSMLYSVQNLKIRAAEG